MPGRRLSSDAELEDLLTRVRTIAVVGLSPRPDRDSHRVAAYLQAAGYRVVPVHPAGGVILDEAVYPSLRDVPEGIQVDLVDVFRRGDHLPGVVAEAVASRPGIPLWLQFGVVHAEAEETALEAGLDVVVDRCIKVEHARLVGGGRR